MAEPGYGYTNTKLKHLAGEMAYDLHAKSRNKPMSNNWLLLLVVCFFGKMENSSVKC